MPADLIIVSNEKYDHGGVFLTVNKRNPDFETVFVKQAMQGNQYNTFDFSFVRVEAVKAARHLEEYAGGYILTLSTGISIYVSGDIEEIDYELAAKLKERGLDYAFYNCNPEGAGMRAEEASQYAELINAKHSIPYHTSADYTLGLDGEYAEKFEAEGKLILTPSELIAFEDYEAWEIGETGPAGGHVFYDKGNYSDGWRYLEAAPVSTEFYDIKWGADHANCYGTEREVRKGAGNTEIALKKLEILRESCCAAQLCVDLDYNGFDDWFLPSVDELVLIYTNLKQNGLGDFNDSNHYWSSSRVQRVENGDSFREDHAWSVDFSNCEESFYLSQYFPHYARAIRAF